MKKEMTSDKFFALCDRLDDASFRCGNWYPTIEEIQKYLEPQIEQNLEFLLWISETADEPTNPDDVDTRTYINDLINNNIVITD